MQMNNLGKILIGLCEVTIVSLLGFIGYEASASFRVLIKLGAAITNQKISCFKIMRVAVVGVGIYKIWE